MRQFANPPLVGGIEFFWGAGEAGQSPPHIRYLIAGGGGADPPKKFDVIFLDRGVREYPSGQKNILKSSVV